MRFEQAFVPADVRRLPPDLPFPLEVSLRCQDPGHGPVIVEMRVRIPPDQDEGQPYDVEVSYIGRFGVGDLPEGLTREKFARSNAAAILFPFVRATIADVTMRGSVGPLLVPPVNVVAMLDESRKDETIPA